MSKNPIIVFEGIEGSGKTTHINNVIKHLKKKRKKFIKIREPGGAPTAEKIRKLILNKKSKFNYTTDLMLYFASRSENIEKIINNNYKKKIILIDRFTDSTIAYQHYGMKISKKIIVSLNSFLLNKIKPDFTFVHIVSKKNLFYRLKKRIYKNKYDRFNLAFYNRVQNGFKKISKNKKNYMIVNSNNELKVNKQIIINKINSIIS